MDIKPEPVTRQWSRLGSSYTIILLVSPSIIQDISQSRDPQAGSDIDIISIKNSILFRYKRNYPLDRAYKYYPVVVSSQVMTPAELVDQGRLLMHQILQL